MDAKILNQIDELNANIQGWETSTLQRIGRRIKKTGRLSLADVKSLNNAAVVREDLNAIFAELSLVTEKNISELEKIYAEAINSEHIKNKALYDYRDIKFVPFEENQYLQSVVKSYAKNTAGTMLNITNTKAIGFTNKAGRFISIDDTMYNILAKSATAITTGVSDFNSAMRDTVLSLGGSGVRVNYESGISRRLDTVVRQNLLWSVKEAQNQYQKDIGAELGCDGIEVDWHSNPRPGHVFLQGRQFCNGKSRMINGVFFQGADEADPTSEDGQTAYEALNDYGCLHRITSIICGVSEPALSASELENLNEEAERYIHIDDKLKTGYEWKQDMRVLESYVRTQKDKIAIAEASGDYKIVDECTAKIKAAQKKYKQISEATGIKAQFDKMRIIQNN